MCAQMVHYRLMRLRQWLKQEKLTVRAFAASIGETDSITRKWVYGQRQPSLPKAVAIQEYTGGAVTVRDLIVADTVAPSAAAA